MTPLLFDLLGRPDLSLAISTTRSRSEEPAADRRMSELDPKRGWPVLTIAGTILSRVLEPNPPLSRLAL